MEMIYFDFDVQNPLFMKLLTFKNVIYGWYIGNLWSILLIIMHIKKNVMKKKE